MQAGLRANPLCPLLSILMADSAYPRLAGTLVPVFALRHENDFGIGDTEAVRQAITFCADQKLGLLQVLPINETGDDNSPYNAISSVALDPGLPHPDAGAGARPAGRRRSTKCIPTRSAPNCSSGPVQYRQVKQLKLEVLSHAYVEFEAVDLETGTDLAYEFQAFVEDNMGWLPGYTLFRTLLNEYSNNALWHEWIPEHQTLADAEIWLTTAADREELVRYRQFTAYVQWIAWRQWAEVRAWADRKQGPAGRRHSVRRQPLQRRCLVRARALRPDLVRRRAAGTVLHRRRISPPLGPELGHSALRLADASRAKLRLVAPAHHGDRPDLPRLPHRPRARLFPHLQLPLDAAAGRRVRLSQPRRRRS